MKFCHLTIWPFLLSGVAPSYRKRIPWYHQRLLAADGVQMLRFHKNPFPSSRRVFNPASSSHAKDGSASSFLLPFRHQPASIIISLRYAAERKSIGDCIEQATKVTAILSSERSPLLIHPVFARERKARSRNRSCSCSQSGGGTAAALRNTQRQVCWFATLEITLVPLTQKVQAVLYCFISATVKRTPDQVNKIENRVAIYTPARMG